MRSGPVGRWFATVAILAPWLIVFLMYDARSETSSVRIAPDDGGRITDWMLCAAADRHEFFLPTLAEIVTKAPGEVRFHILHQNEETRRELTRQLESRRFNGFDRLRWHPVGSDLSFWTRDLFVTGRTDRSAPVILLHHPDHYRTMFEVARDSGLSALREIRRLSGFRKQPTLARVEGGALVASREHVFVPLLYAQLAVDRGDCRDREECVADLEELYGLPVVLLDVPFTNTYRHADQYLTPIGNRVVMLGDPELAIRLVEKEPSKALAGLLPWFEAMGRCEGFGHVRTLTADDLDRCLPGPGNRSYLSGVTERIASRMRALGYEVVHIPWLPLRFDGGRFDLRFSYNNVVLENRDGRKTVYLPWYGVPPLDRKARAIWEERGYRVVPIEAAGPAMFGGAVRCLSQVFRSG